MMFSEPNDTTTEPPTHRGSTVTVTQFYPSKTVNVQKHLHETNTIKRGHMKRFTKYIASFISLALFIELCLRANGL